MVPLIPGSVCRVFYSGPNRGWVNPIFPTKNSQNLDEPCVAAAGVFENQSVVWNDLTYWAGPVAWLIWPILRPGLASALP